MRGTYLGGGAALLPGMSDERWPAWARGQLLAAVSLARALPRRQSLAGDLYDRWYAAPAETVAARPLAGEYRRAHAGTAVTVVGGLPVLERHDDLGRDGWWRTWNTTWRPRRDGARVLLSPRAGRVGDLIGGLTAALRDTPYLLASPLDPVRLARPGAVVVHVPDVAAFGLQPWLGPLLRADTPPLCLPVAPGVAVAHYPDNGMTFGEHRCHLVALALATGRERPREPALHRIAAVFTAHGVDPSTPYRSAGGGRR